ncbi:MAG TPA: riboflavin synthase [Holophagaceae bacterium]|jgi:riboflavin synthase|nr:riboflavin synthase [Holophagaceae bacterium]
MFTGLIRHLGALESRSSRSGGARVRIAAPREVLERAMEGASIAVNGCCLTAVARDSRAWEADLSEETLAKTTLGQLKIGSKLHLEPALCVGDPLDGHLMLGHVDAFGALQARPAGEGVWRFSMPAELAPLVAEKGSIAVDGVSLTVVDAGADYFTVALIPETVIRTAFAEMRPGDLVNLEADPLARYAARLLSTQRSGAKLSKFAEGGWAAMETWGPDPEV